MSNSLDERSHLSARQAAEAPPAFTRIVTFKYYDGPEAGLAKTAAGDAYRFEDVGESRYRCFRAFLFDRLLEQAPFDKDDCGGGFDWLATAEWELVQQAPTGERYVGISDLGLQGLVVKRLEQGAPPPSSFAEAHTFLKSKFAWPGQTS